MMLKTTMIVIMKVVVMIKNKKIYGNKNLNAAKVNDYVAKSFGIGKAV